MVLKHGKNHKVRGVVARAVFQPQRERLRFILKIHGKVSSCLRRIWALFNHNAKEHVELIVEDDEEVEIHKQRRFYRKSFIQEWRVFCQVVRFFTVLSRTSLVTHLNPRNL